jgi:hypothetical protein
VNIKPKLITHTTNATDNGFFNMSVYKIMVEKLYITTTEVPQSRPYLRQPNAQNIKNAADFFEKRLGHQ